ncbi:hypothetical protein V3C99_005029 [Haemonchus contortus]
MQTKKKEPAIIRSICLQSCEFRVLTIVEMVARRFLFIDPKKKAVAFLAFVALLSLVSSFVTLDNSLYIVQKHSVFNQYGVKLGWMWTCFIVGPFIWFSSRAHHRDKDKSIIDLLRLAVATFCWYASIWHGLLGVISVFATHELCVKRKANAFREWHQVVHRDDDCGIVMRERQEKRVKLAQYFVVAMLILNIIWIKQLAISILYYHIMIDKIAGALVAIFWWYTTYHILYPNGFLQPPIHRTKPVANRRR